MPRRPVRLAPAFPIPTAVISGPETMSTIRTSHEDKVGTIALDNFAKRNALGEATVREMIETLAQFESQGVRAVVVRTAEFGHVWSAGHDIDELPVRGDPRSDGDGLGRVGGCPPPPAPPPDAADAYYRRWATEEFGAESADALTKIYPKEYFAAPGATPGLWPARLSSAGNAPPPMEQSDVPRVEGDQHYHTEARRLILDSLSEHQVIAIPSQSPKWTQPRVLPAPDAPARAAADRPRHGALAPRAQPRWDAV